MYRTPKFAITNRVPKMSTTTLCYAPIESDGRAGGMVFGDRSMDAVLRGRHFFFFFCCVCSAILRPHVALVIIKGGGCSCVKSANYFFFHPAPSISGCQYRSRYTHTHEQPHRKFIRESVLGEIVLGTSARRTQTSASHQFYNTDIYSIFL